MYEYMSFPVNIHSYKLLSVQPFLYAIENTQRCSNTRPKLYTPSLPTDYLYIQTQFFMFTLRKAGTVPSGKGRKCRGVLVQTQSSHFMYAT